jgi:hypothetical protein
MRPPLVAFVGSLLLLAPAGAPASGGDPLAGLFILQANEPDPTAPTSQPTGRWYHWLGCDPAVTHLETGIAVDAGQFAGRGQRFTLREPAGVAALEVKIKRIGQPGALVWEAGTAWGRRDLGRGEVPAREVSVNFEQFVAFPLQAGPGVTSPVPGGPAPVRTPQIFLRLRAASGRCPDDYYAVYATWKENHPGKVRVNSYAGPQEVGMMFRALGEDSQGTALEADGTALAEGASMMNRVLTKQPGPRRRALLPGEEDPYTFVESLAAGRDPRKLGLPWPGLRPERGEIALDYGWRIQIATPSSPQVVVAVADLGKFLAESMKLDVAATWTASARPAPRTILITQGPDLAEGPRQPGGYRVAVQPNRVQIHGFDARGVLRGIWYLEDLLLLRGGPVLPIEARTREPRYSPRATCAAWGGMGELVTPAPVYTNAHLSLISHYGYDAIWLGWAPGPERDQPLPTRIAPGCVPQGTTCQPYLPRLRDLIERADRYGLEVVIQYIAPYPRDDAGRRAVARQARDFVRDLPKVRTIVLADEGLGSARAGKMEAWVDQCNLLAGALLEARPDVRVAAWRYTYAARTAERAEWDQRMALFSHIDRRVAYMASVDAFWMRRHDGLLQHAYDYCLSLRAPAEDFRHAADCLAVEARRDGLPPRKLLAHLESRFSQEANTQPEIPCMQRWLERYQAVNDFDTLPIQGMIANWYHQGFYPTVVTELFGWSSYTNAPPAHQLLAALARRDFGPQGAAAAMEAWDKFSQAIWHFPFYFGLSYPMNAGLAQPFWLDPHAPNPRPWRRGFVNSLKMAALEDSGQGPGSGRENRARLREFQELWNAGLGCLRKAVDQAPGNVRPRADDHWRTARTIGDKADMTLRLVRWFDARDRLTRAAQPAEARAALDDLEQVGREELAADRAALPMYLGDSRMGHLNHGRGCFTALSILNKIEALEKTLSEELPRLRADRWKISVERQN